MICLVRGVTLATKETCTLALVNLLTPTTFAQMIQAGYLQALSNLSTSYSQSPNIIHSCALAFYLFSGQSQGRTALCAKPATLKAFYSLLTTKGKTHIRFETIEILAMGLCHMLHCEDAMDTALAIGGISALTALHQVMVTSDSTSSSSSSRRRIPDILLHLSAQPASNIRLLMIAQGALGLCNQILLQALELEDSEAQCQILQQVGFPIGRCVNM